MPIQSQIPASSTSGGGQNRCGTCTVKTSDETVKTAVETGLSQQLLKSGVETDQQHLSLSVSTVVSTASQR